VAGGTPVTLADGQVWALANPTYCPRPDGLTSPLVDRALDRLVDGTILDQKVSLCDVWDAARRLLGANYHLTDDEIAELLGVRPGPESESLAEAVFEALLGARGSEKSFTAWVRATLLANGLNREGIPAADLPNVLEVLVATNRTIPFSKFADACQILSERARLDALL
jgi:hypothetical protein